MALFLTWVVLIAISMVGGSGKRGERGKSRDATAKRVVSLVTPRQEKL
jgi:hypothetical protein